MVKYRDVADAFHLGKLAGSPNGPLWNLDPLHEADSSEELEAIISAFKEAPGAS